MTWRERVDRINIMRRKMPVTWQVGLLMLLIVAAEIAVITWRVVTP